MAQVTITIIDNEDGSVGVTSNPDALELKEALKQFVLDPDKNPVAESYKYAMRMLGSALRRSVDIRSEIISNQGKEESPT